MRIVNRKVPLLLVLLALSLISNFFLWNWRQSDATSKPEPKQMQSDFLSLTHHIGESFEYKDYIEIMKDKNHMLSLPMEAFNPDLLGRQKLFLFKSRDSNTMIFLDVSTTSSKTNEEWNHSFNYSPQIFEHYADHNSILPDSVFPNHEFALQSFSKENYNFVILVSSDQKTDNFAASEAVGFANALLKYLSTHLNK